MAPVQDPYALEAKVYAKRPAEGLEVAERMLAAARAASVDGLTLANLRYQAALIAGYAGDEARERGWLRAIVETPQEVVAGEDGQRLYQRALHQLRSDLFEDGDDRGARSVTEAALTRIGALTALEARDRADLSGKLRLSASDRGISTGDYRSSLDWVAPIFADAELLLGAESAAGTLAMAARQRSLFQYELGDVEGAFAGIDRVAEQLEAAPALGERRMSLIALLRDRELMLASSEPAERVAASIAKAEALIARCEAVRGEGRIAALRSACSVVRMIGIALPDDRIEARAAGLDRALGWLRSDPELMDPAHHALPYVFDIAQNLYGNFDAAQVEAVAAVDGRMDALIAEASAKYGSEALADHVEDLDQSRRRLRYLMTQRGLIGEPAPDLGITAVVHGGAVERRGLSWKELRGQVVLLEFWNVHCGPCIQAFPKLAAMERELGERGFVVLGHTSFYKQRWDEASRRPVEDESTTEAQELDMLLKFADQTQARHRLVVEGGHEVNARYGVLANPTAFLIDRKGRVRYAAEGLDLESAEFKALLERLLEEPAD